LTVRNESKLYYDDQGRRKAGTTREIHAGAKGKKDISVLGTTFLTSMEIHPLSEPLAPALMMTETIMKLKLILNERPNEKRKKKHF
jgi:hypothetical protein